MNRFVSILIIAFLMSSAFTAHASSVQVSGKLDASGFYYTNATGFFRFLYINNDIPQDSVIVLHYGFTRSEWQSGYLQPISDWNERAVITASPAETGVWEASLQNVMYSRGSSWHRSHVNFVFIVIKPDGSVFYDKGVDTEFGYYEIEAPGVNLRCPEEADGMCPLTISTKYQ